MSDLADAARRLLAAEPGEGSLADRVVRVRERVSQHLARLVGEIGVDTLWKRSIVVASAQVPWLSSGKLHEAMAQQAPEIATDGFVVVFSTFVDLLKRLIGEGLVDRLLGEVWPEVFLWPKRRLRE